MPGLFAAKKLKKNRQNFKWKDVDYKRKRIDKILNGKT